LVIDKMESVIDSVQENWADPEYIKEALAGLPFDDGELEIAINDELARIQVNALVDFPKGRSFNPAQQQLWLRFLEALSSGVEIFEDLEPAEVVNPIKDWLDRGDDDAITGISGAESDYYQDRDPPYACRNGPLKHIQELRLVKGVSSELFDGLQDIVGLSQYLTVYGMSAADGRGFTFKGKININTAKLPVIAALLPIEHVDLAPQIIEYRSTAEEGQFIHDLSQPMWYKKIPGMQDVTIDSALLTISSDLFRIDATAVKNKLSVKISSVVQREKDKETGRWRCRIISQKEVLTNPNKDKGEKETAPLGS